MKRVSLSLLALLSFGLTPQALAQVDTGSIVGTVRDKSGAVVPGASVSLRESTTNALTTLLADAAGSYVATPLRVRSRAGRDDHLHRPLAAADPVRRASRVLEP